MPTSIPMSSGGGSSTRIGGVGYDGRTLYTLHTNENTLSSLTPPHDVDPPGTYHRWTWITKQDALGNLKGANFDIETWFHGRVSETTVGGLYFHRNYLICYANIRDYDGVLLRPSDMSLITTIPFGNTFFSDLTYNSNKFFFTTGSSRTIFVSDGRLSNIIKTYDFTSQLTHATSRIDGIDWHGRKCWVSIFDANNSFLSSSNYAFAEVDFKNEQLINPQVFDVPVYAMLYNQRNGFYISYSSQSLGIMSF